MTARNIGRSPDTQPEESIDLDTRAKVKDIALGPRPVERRDIRLCRSVNTLAASLDQTVIRMDHLQDRPRLGPQATRNRIARQRGDQEILSAPQKMKGGQHMSRGVTAEMLVPI
jgi:hypothetical protein